jgi:hypothetical protein
VSRAAESAEKRNRLAGFSPARVGAHCSISICSKGVSFKVCSFSRLKLQVFQAASANDLRGVTESSAEAIDAGLPAVLEP